MNNKPTNVNTWRVPAVAATLLLALVIFGFIIKGEPRPPLKKSVAVIAASAKTSSTTKTPADTQNKKTKDTVAVQSPVKHTAKVKKMIKAPVGVVLPTVAPTTVITEPVTKTAVVETSGLDEAIVLDYSAKKKTAETQVPIVAATPLDEALVMDYVAKKKAVHPKNGWDNFQKYINAKAVSADGKTGTVELSFTVNNKGTVNNDVKVTKSLSNTADKTAIDLIKNGPPWDDTDTSAEPVTVKVQFH